MQIGSFFCSISKSREQQKLKKCESKKATHICEAFFIVSQLRLSMDEIKACRSRKCAVDRGLSVC